MFIVNSLNISRIGVTILNKGNSLLTRAKILNLHLNAATKKSLHITKVSLYT
jgi:hypothetical protein